jgi:hypothetical protein
MDPTYTFQTFDDRVDHVTPTFNNFSESTTSI